MRKKWYKSTDSLSTCWFFLAVVHTSVDIALSVCLFTMISTHISFSLSLALFDCLFVCFDDMKRHFFFSPLIHFVFTWGNAHWTKHKRQYVPKIHTHTHTAAHKTCTKTFCAAIDAVVSIYLCCVCHCYS